MTAEEAVEEKSKRRRRRRGQDAEEEIAEPEVEDRGVSERKGRATPSKRDKTAEESRGNIVVRSMRGIRGYFTGVSDELDKVVWPTREELFRLTWIVLAATVGTAVFLGIVSFIYTEIFIIGIQNNHPVIFVALFGAAGAGYYYISRMLRKSSQP